MNTDTKNFLESLLFNAECEADDIRGVMLQGKTVYDFTPAFTEAVEKFIDGFRAHLEKTGFDMSKLDNAERSFGGNVYFSLSGAGVGFFDDSDPEVAGLHDILKAWAGGNRFEELAGMLEVDDDGNIDLAFFPHAIKEYYAKIFGVPEEQSVGTESAGLQDFNDRVKTLNQGPHTPGPWKKCGGYSAKYCAVHSLKGYIVFRMADREEDTENGKPIEAPSYDEQHANARLIASAPELLQSLEAVMKFWRESKDEEMPAGMFDDALRAIAKAKGGSL